MILSIAARNESAISALDMFPLVRQKACTPYWMSAARSAGLYRMRSSFMRTGHARLPASSSHSRSVTFSSAGMPYTSAKVRSSMPAARNSAGALMRPRLRSTKKPCGGGLARFTAQAATRVATRTASSSSGIGTPNSSATSPSDSPARKSDSASSRRTPPRAKIGCPKPRVGSTITSATE